MNTIFNMRQSALFGALALLLQIAPISARSADRNSSADAELLLTYEPIVITASKTAVHISDAPAAVTVINEDTIRQSGATSLVDLLRSVPGIDVMSPNKSQDNVSVEGLNRQFANKLLVMIDGRSIYQDYLGNVFWSLEPLLISRIKRIEIVRGPGSALYGANAFNGVINIITKTPEEMQARRQHLVSSAAAGEQKSLFSETAYSGVIGNGSAKGGVAYTLGFGYHSTDGFGGDRPGQVRDGSSVPMLTLDMQKQTGRGTWILSAGESHAKADLTASTYQTDASWDTRYASLTYQDALRVRNPVLLRFFHNGIALRNTTVEDLTSWTDDVEIQQQIKPTYSQTIIFGANYRSTTFQSGATGPEWHSRHLWNLYGEDDLRLAKQTHLFAGARVDSNSAYGTNFSPRLSVVHHMADSQTIRVSYGTAYRAPTLVDNYADVKLPLFPGVDLHAVGNLNVKPERVTSLEVGYRKDVREGFVSANVFMNRITNQIVGRNVEFAGPPFPPGIPITNTPENQGGARAAGVEFESQFLIGRALKGYFNYTYQNVRDDSGRQSFFSPNHKANFVIETLPANRFIAYLAAHRVGAAISSEDPAAPHLSPYSRFDVRLGYRFGSTNYPWTASLLATNAFDDKHLEYPLPNTPNEILQTTPQRRTVWFRLDFQR